MNNRLQRTLLIGITLWIITTLACSLPGLTKPNNSPQDQTDLVSDLNDTEETPTGVEVIPDRDTLLGGGGEPVTIQIPPGAYQEGTSLQLSVLSDLPGDLEEGLSGIGAAFGVKVQGESLRSEEPMQVTVQFNGQGIEQVGEILVGYYHENYGWYLIDPDEVDLEAGTLTFTTYHFSDYAVLRADEDQRIDHFIEKSATEEFVRMTAGEQSDKVIQDMVREIMVEGAGIVDNRVLELVTKAVVKQLPFGKVAIALADQDKDELMKMTLETSLSELGKLISEDDTVLRDITGSGSTVGAFASASGHIAEGDLDGALQVMGNEILANTPAIGRIKEITEDVIEIYDEVINNVWFNPEMEKAYRVYKDGAEGGWFGYSVDAGDWDQLESQMHGIFAKARTNYVESYCKARGIDPNSLNPDQWNRIGDEGMERIKTQFDKRNERRADIEAIQAQQHELMELFAERGLLDESISTNPMYTGNEDLEMLMTRLQKISQKLMTDLGRTNVVDHHQWNSTDPFERDKLIQPEVLAEMVSQFYSNRLNEKPEVYDQVLNEIEQRLSENEGFSVLDIQDMTKKFVEESLVAEADEDDEDDESPGEGVPDLGFIQPTPNVSEIEEDSDYVWDDARGCWNYVGEMKNNYSWNCENQCFDYREGTWSYDCATDCWVSSNPNWTYDCDAKCSVYVGSDSNLWRWNCNTNCWDYLDPNYTWDCSTKCHIYVGPDTHLWSYDCANKCLRYTGPKVEGWTWSCGAHKWIADEE